MRQTRTEQSTQYNVYDSRCCGHVGENEAGEDDDDEDEDEEEEKRECKGEEETSSLL